MPKVGDPSNDRSEIRRVVPSRVDANQQCSNSRFYSSSTFASMSKAGSATKLKVQPALPDDNGRLGVAQQQWVDYFAETSPHQGILALVNAENHSDLTDNTDVP